MTRDKDTFGLSEFQALLLFLLEFFTKKQWQPEEYTPPEPPKPDLPEWVLAFGDLNRWEAKYSKRNDKAFYLVEEIKAPVFFSASRYSVTRDDGSKAWKNIFEARTNDLVHVPLAVPNGKIIAGYRYKVPSSIYADAQEYADGKVYIEICDPAGGVIWPEHVRMLGYIENGKYMEAEYPGL